MDLGSCARMRWIKGAATLNEDEYSIADVSIGSTSPIPPSLDGKAKSLRSMSFGGGLPVNAGMSLVRILSSRG